MITFNNNFEIDLNHIVTWEMILNKENKSGIPEDLQVPVIRTLMSKDVYALEKDRLSDNKVKTFEELDKKCPNHYVRMKQRIKGKVVSVVYDYFASCILEPNDAFYSFFFARKLRQVGLHSIDPFLDYQLAKHYKNDIESFKRFLNLTKRGFKVFLTDNDLLETINEWMVLKTESLRNTEKDLNCVGDNIVTWTADKGDFIKLIYSMFFAKKINNGKGDITKITAALAKVFGIDFGEKDNTLSKKINNTKEKDRLFTIFSELEITFSQYVDSLKKKQKKQK